MIKLLHRNLLLEVQEADATYGNGLLVKADAYRGISGKFILRDKAADCSYPIPLGAEVIIEMDSEDVERNIVEREGIRYFIIRESFAILYLEPEEENKKENQNEKNNVGLVSGIPADPLSW